MRFYRKLKSGKNETSDSDKTRSTKCLFPRAGDRSRSWPDFLFFECYCVLFQEKHSLNIWKAEIKRLKGLCRARPKSRVSRIWTTRISQCIIFPLRLWRGAGLSIYGGEIVTIASCVCLTDLSSEWCESGHWFHSQNSLTCLPPSLRIQIDLELTFAAMH